MKFTEKLKLRKVTQVLRYPVVKSNILPEEYVHYLLFLLYQFRGETNVVLHGSYCKKRNGSNVLDVINRIRIFDSNIDEDNPALILYKSLFITTCPCRIRVSLMRIQKTHTENLYNFVVTVDSIPLIGDDSQPERK